jgi:hypothetical protein
MQLRYRPATGRVIALGFLARYKNNNNRREVEEVKAGHSKGGVSSWGHTNTVASAPTRTVCVGGWGVGRGGVR